MADTNIMKNKNKTNQEKFWSGDFNKEYIDRNNIDDKVSNIPSRSNMFYKVLSNTHNVASITEFGSNIGMNLLAIKTIKPNIDINAIEISSDAYEKLTQIENVNSINKSILELEKGDIPVSDITFTSGVLIHINPEMLENVYDNLYKFSRRYIMVAEYYNPTPTMIPYHGKNDMLFKRDFAGEILDRFSDLRLVNYGFHYHRDNHFPLGDITWFLMEKV